MARELGAEQETEFMMFQSLKASRPIEVIEEPRTISDILFQTLNEKIS